MTDEIVTDLKQFITATVSHTISQQLGEFRVEIDKRFDQIDTRLIGLDKRFDDLNLKFDDLKDFVIDTFDTTNEVNGKAIRKLERRVYRLERKVA